MIYVNWNVIEGMRTTFTGRKRKRQEDDGVGVDKGGKSRNQVIFSFFF